MDAWAFSNYQATKGLFEKYFEKNWAVSDDCGLIIAPSTTYLKIKLILMLFSENKVINGAAEHENNKSSEQTLNTTSSPDFSLIWMNQNNKIKTNYM